MLFVESDAKPPGAGLSFSETLPWACAQRLVGDHWSEEILTNHFLFCLLPKLTNYKITNFFYL